METFMIISSALLFINSISLFISIRIINELDERNVAEIKYNEKLLKRLEEEQKCNDELTDLYNKLIMED